MGTRADRRPRPPNPSRLGQCPLFVAVPDGPRLRCDRSREHKGTHKVTIEQPDGSRYVITATHAEERDGQIVPYRPKRKRTRFTQIEARARWKRRNAIIARLRAHRWHLARARASASEESGQGG